jgi:hypothetical protein
VGNGAAVDETKGIVANVTALFGLVAGVGVLLYVLGGAVVALRLWYAGLPVWAVVSQLPREMLVTEALVDVVLPFTLATGAYLAWRVIGFTGARLQEVDGEGLDAPDPDRRFLMGYLATAMISFLLVAITKGLFEGAGGGVVLRILGLMVGVGLLTYTLGLLSLAGRVHLQGPLEESSTEPRNRAGTQSPIDFRRLTAIGLLFAMPLLPVFVGVASVFPLLRVKACATERRWEKSGLLVSHSTDTLYLGRDVAERGRRPIVVIPIDRIEELLIGSDVQTIQRLPCDPVVAPEPTPGS